MIRKLAPAAATALLLATAGCGGGGGPAAQDGAMSKAELTAEQDRIRRGCASEITYQRLKELAFDEARRIRGSDSPNLDRLATAAVLRMEEPLVKSRDEKLNVTVCRGRLILELPPGTEPAFAGQRRLVANVEYAAQAAADGSGLVYQMDGAEPIVYRLAAFDPRTAPGPAGPATLPPQPAVVAADRPPEAAVETIRAGSGEEREEAESRDEIVVREVEDDDAPVTVIRTARPSFNCRYARSSVEKMICADDRLAALDRRMASSFYAALAATRGPERMDLQRSRNAFVIARDRCRSAECIADSYHERIAELRDYR
ncbi:MAG: hypothetical protein JWL91_638 [Sphingomonas bacterium]|nr:hypothetical protein [Sphingomonas bacterium]MDB5688762.1 hypothetical protein [Sphingomonas bacterium]